MFDKWYYDNKRVVGLTNHLIDFSVVQARGGWRDCERWPQRKSES